MKALRLSVTTEAPAGYDFPAGHDLYIDSRYGWDSGDRGTISEIVQKFPDKEEISIIVFCSDPHYVMLAPGPSAVLVHFNAFSKDEVWPWKLYEFGWVTTPSEDLVGADTSIGKIKTGAKIHKFRKRSVIELLCDL